MFHRHLGPRLARALRRAALLAALGVCCGGAVAQTPATPPASAASSAAAMPASIFLRAPDLQSATLSPSGRWLAVTATAPGSRRNTLRIFDLAGAKAPVEAASFNDSDIGGVRWVGDERLVFSLLDLSDQALNRFPPGLFSVGREGQDLRQLVNLRSRALAGPTRIVDRRLLPWNHGLLHVPQGPGEEVIVGEWVLNKADELVAVVPKRLNVVNGLVKSMTEDLPGPATGWLFDTAGAPRVAVAHQGGRTRVQWRAPGQNAWQEIGNFESVRAPWTPHAVDGQGQLWVTAPTGPGRTAALKRFDFTRMAPEQEALVTTPGFDFSGTLLGTDAGPQTLGVRVEMEREATIWFDERLRAVQQAVDALLPGRVNRIECRRCGQDEMVALVSSWSDRDPGQYWIYRPATGTLSLVGRLRRDVPPERMATLQLRRIAARDGRELPLWLTLPAGAEAGTPRPAVVLVHGGPWVRGGHWRWDPEAQFLASRGYVVVEPEFRGSTGYGADHFQAGWRQWGQAMQDDVADALAWAVQAGWVDRTRVCIAGASYGGYAVLMGLVRDPGLYRCGAAWVAVTDPRLLLEEDWSSDLSDEVRLHSLPVLVGDPVADAARLEAASPVAQAARIRAPLLLAFGEADRRVTLQHGTRLRRALVEAGNAPEYVVYDGEGHGWRQMEHKLDFHARLERFLAQHLR